MAVELMMGYGCADGFPTSENAVSEAASAGMQSIGEFIRLLSHNCRDRNRDVSSSSSSSNLEPEKEIKVAAEVAVNNFKKVISLLGRPRTGHARFRRAPIKQEKTESTNPQSNEQPVSAFKVYCPTPVHRLPPLPHNHLHRTQLNKTEPPSTINFSNSPQISATNSFISSLTGDTDSVQPSLSSGFQFTTPSSVGKPPLSSSLKRKCNSMDDAALNKCGSSSGRCHCSKKRYLLFCHI